jgi:flagellar assembly protein FliH
MSITRHQAVGAYRRWEPPSFDAPRAPESDPPPAPEAEPESAAPPPAPLAPAPQEPPPPTVRLPTAEDIERIHDAAQKEGYAAGYEEGTARGRMEALRLNTLVECLDQALGNIDTEVAEELLALAIEIARQMVRRSLKQDRQVIVDIVKEALQQLPQNHALIHLHPEDATLVRHHLGEQLAHVGNRVIEDERVNPGGCRVEAAGSQIDATVQTRWRRILENLGRSECDWDLGPGE